MKPVVFVITLATLAAILLGVPLAQQPTPTTTSATPSITDAHKYAYAKAQLHLTAAQTSLSVAQSEMQAAIVNFTTDCGADFGPQLDQQGDPVCTKKPAAVKATPPAPPASK